MQEIKTAKMRYCCLQPKAFYSIDATMSGIDRNNSGFYNTSETKKMPDRLGF